MSLFVRYIFLTFIIMLQLMSPTFAAMDGISGRAFTHEAITPDIRCINSHISCGKAVLTFDAYNKHFQIPLYKNTELFTQDYFIQVDDAIDANPFGGRALHDLSPADSCYYLSSDPAYTASFSLCDNQVNGFFNHESESFSIRYDEELGTHSLFREEDLPQIDGRCGTTEYLSELRAYGSGVMRSLEPRESRTVESRATPRSRLRYLEWFLTIDQSAFENRFQSKMDQVQNFTKYAVNYLNMVYRKPPIQVNVVLKGLVIWQKEDKIKITGGIQETLIRFIDYNLEKIFPIHKQDSSMLITARSFPASPQILGVALKGTTCNAPELSAVLVRFPPGYGYDAVSHIVSHETGHNIGFDDEIYTSGGNCAHDCKDDKKNANCIMGARYSGVPAVDWSECSKWVFEYRHADSRYGCLKGVTPQYTPLIGYCGNGIVEADEECDCPVSYDSDDERRCEACCDMSAENGIKKCKLKEGAKCASGLCCDLYNNPCQFLNRHIVCRDAIDKDCDFVDVCSGDSELCYDGHVDNRTKCGTGDMWCFNGICEDRCFRNCYGNGRCDENGVCHCNKLSEGKFCQARFFFTPHIIMGVVLMFLSTVLTLLVFIIKDYATGKAEKYD